MTRVLIPGEWESFVECLVASGHYRSPTEVVSDALRLLARRERFSQDVKAGVAQLDRGEYTEYDEKSLDKFLADIEASEPPSEPLS
jgi:putative addiction module CopG family antidote